MYQLITIAGNVGKDAEMRYTPNGKAVASFNVATNSQYTNNNGEVIKETTWFRVTTWGKQAEICNQYVKKGMKVLVVGKLTADPATGGPRIWSAQDGSPHTAFEINADTVRFLNKAGETSHESNSDIPGESHPATAPSEDEFPF